MVRFHRRALGVGNGEMGLVVFETQGSASMAKNGKKWWLGFDSMSGRMLAGDPAEMRFAHGIVSPKTTISICNRPQIARWRGERLFVHQPVASSFLIHDIRVGNLSAICAYGPIPADAFATRMDRLAYVQDIFDREGVIEMKIEKTGAEVLGMEWPLPMARAAAEVTLIIENISEEPARFLAGFLGEGPSDDCV